MFKQCHTWATLSLMSLFHLSSWVHQWMYIILCVLALTHLTYSLRNTWKTNCQLIIRSPMDTEQSWRSLNSDINNQVTVIMALSECMEKVNNYSSRNDWKDFPPLAFCSHCWASIHLPLTGGLIVKSCFIDLPRLQPCQLPLVIANKSDHDVVIPARPAITEMSAIQTSSQEEQSVSDPVQVSSSDSSRILKATDEFQLTEITL